MIDNISLIAQSAVRIKDILGRIIYFDPFKLEDEYVKDADYIFISHPHFDHFSPDDILKIKKERTKIIAPIELNDKIKKLGFNEHDVMLVEPNNEYEIENIIFQTIPAYNINKDFHKREFNWVGYIVVIDGKRIYFAGDTDCTDEARRVKCDVAFVPIGGTYTMTCDEAVGLIKEIKPGLAIPMHYATIVGSVDDALNFKELLKDDAHVEILMM